MKAEIVIREIRDTDNRDLENVIKRSLEEYDMALDGTVYTDPVIKTMSSQYTDAGSAYFIAEHNGVLCGGGGISKLNKDDTSVCELQRMFLSSAYRGKGIGYRLLQHCIDYAKASGYSFCYLETSEKLHDAVRLYEKFGFKYLDGAMGSTGHFSCTTYMGMELIKTE